MDIWAPCVTLLLVTLNSCCRLVDCSKYCLFFSLFLLYYDEVWLFTWYFFFVFVFLPFSLLHSYSPHLICTHMHAASLCSLQLKIIKKLPQSREIFLFCFVLLVSEGGSVSFKDARGLHVVYPVFA